MVVHNYYNLRNVVTNVPVILDFRQVVIMRFKVQKNFNELVHFVFIKV